MRKIYSIFSLLLVFALSFTACSKDDNNTPGGGGVKSVTFASETTFSEDLLGLIDVTCTYTSLDGQTKSIALNNGKVTISDSSTKLPSQLKVTFTGKKSKNYDAYKATKNDFILEVNGPSIAADYVASNGKTYQAAPHTTANKHSEKFAKDDNFDKTIDSYITKVIENLLSFTGTFSKVDDGASFTKN